MRIIIIGKRELSALVLGLIAFCMIFYSLFTLRPASISASAQPYYQGSGEENLISLTLNVDWGGEYIPQILEVLEKEQIKATFFLTGRWADENPQIAGQIAEAGHEIGNHAYSHKSPNKAGFQENCQEISRAAQSIKNATGVDTRLYAPPSGERAQSVLDAAEAQKHITILWSVDTIDWKRPKADIIYKRVMKKIHPGAIILAHPTHPTLSALPEIISDLKEKGYQFVIVSELLKLEAENISPED